MCTSPSNTRTFYVPFHALHTEFMTTRSNTKHLLSFKISIETDTTSLLLSRHMNPDFRNQCSLHCKFILVAETSFSSLRVPNSMRRTCNQTRVCESLNRERERDRTTNKGKKKVITTAFGFLWKTITFRKPLSNLSLITFFFYFLIKKKTKQKK